MSNRDKREVSLPSTTKKKIYKHLKKTFNKGYIALVNRYDASDGLCYVPHTPGDGDRIFLGTMKDMANNINLSAKDTRAILDEAQKNVNELYSKQKWKTETALKTFEHWFMEFMLRSYPQMRQVIMDLKTDYDASKAMKYAAMDVTR